MSLPAALELICGCGYSSTTEVKNINIYSAQIFWWGCHAHFHDDLLAGVTWILTSQANSTLDIFSASTFGETMWSVAARLHPVINFRWTMLRGRWGYLRTNPKTMLGFDEYDGIPIEMNSNWPTWLLTFTVLCSIFTWYFYGCNLIYHSFISSFLTKYTHE